MAFVRFRHLKRFVLILTLALAFVAQAWVPAAMAMGQDGATMASMGASHLCPACNDMDHAKGMAADCSGSLCAGVIAVLPVAPVLEAAFASVFGNTVERHMRGIILAPPLGPPRPLHLT